jgi:pimeloyl-ACP methyl ester carboxylesterase
MEPLVVTTPEGEIHGRRFEGDGPPAVLLHGGPGMSASYLDPLAALLAGSFSPILYQQRGLLPTTIDEPFTVETNVADAEAVIDAAAGGRAWIVGHSWGGHLALHLLVSSPERIAGAIIVDPLGAHLEVMEEFGKRLEAPLTDEERARVEEIEAGEEAGTSTAEESMEALRMVWPSYFAAPPTAPPMPDIELVVPAFAGTMASVNAHAEAETLVRGLPAVPAEIPVLFVHGAASPMPVRASTESATLIPHAEVQVIEGAGHFIWHERPDEVRDVVRAFVARSSS